MNTAANFSSMNVNITMTEAEFDEYRLWREHKKKMDTTSIKMAIGQAVLNFIRSVQGSHVHPLSLEHDVKQLRREVDAAFESAKL
jgi:hypothetical protein